VFIDGNHEFRLQRFINLNDNAKLDGALLTITEGLKLRERGYKIYDNYPHDVHRIGKLSVIHGIYTNLHCAKKHLEVFNYHSVIFGHAHIVQVYRVGNDAIAVAVGGLLDIKHKAFNYTPLTQRNKWSNSFAVVHSAKNGHFWIDVIQCIDNSFVYNGKLF
jgi:hypothetical protein